jgi:hypothetical protein
MLLNPTAKKKKKKLADGICDMDFLVRREQRYHLFFIPMGVRWVKT